MSKQVNLGLNVTRKSPGGKEYGQLENAVRNDQYQLILDLIDEHELRLDRSYVLYVATNARMINFLVKLGADVHHGPYGHFDVRTPLEHHAMIYNRRTERLEICQALLEAGADPNGRTLHNAIRYLDGKLIRLLILYGARPTFKGKYPDVVKRVLIIQLLLAKLPRGLHHSLRIMFTEYYL